MGTFYTLGGSCNFNSRAQQSGARFGNRDVVPVAAMQSQPRERQMYVTILAPGGPPQVHTCDLHLLLYWA